MHIGWILPLLALAAPAVAQPATAPAVQADRSTEMLSLELSRILNSEAATQAQLRKMIDETMPNSFAKDPNFQMLEDAYPGITGQAIRAMAPHLEASIGQSLPEMQAEVAVVYRRHFDAAELRELIEFYSSPLGRKLIAGVSEQADFSASLDSAVASGGENAITADQLGQGIALGAGKVVDSLTTSERAEVFRFGLSPLGFKLNKLNVEVQALMAEFANRPDPELEAAIAKSLDDVIARREAEDPE